ncbi:MBL fold metallo-hydrolase, partial [Baekduia sp.]|uniref:MBL fold metallo-hydrolase n=1 Tax=Baekduia sp. TaxID=2600305 RepID=UPI002E068081|nr:MBL fold metallo-hydrolase [Baekduia sp.]
MQVDWYGQSTFRLSDGDQTVAIDPFADMSAAAARGIRFDYPPISGLEADLLLITHEHGDHNGAEVVGGDPVILRSTAGTHKSPIGEVIGIASEHDDVAGTQRGPNTIFAFTFGGVRVAHFGDFGQAALRNAQAAALGQIDLLFIPVGGAPTIGAAQAVPIAEQLGAQWIVPMHYRTERISFLEPIDELLG